MAGLCSDGAGAQREALQDWVIGAGGFASVISMADVPAALSVASDFSASFREIFSLRSFW